MRTLVDIPENELQELNSLSAARKTSRAELVRQAIRAFVEANRPAQTGDGFGLWKHYDIDGDAYQQRIRAEWERDEQIGIPG